MESCCWVNGTMVLWCWERGGLRKTEEVQFLLKEGNLIFMKRFLKFQLIEF